MYIYILCMPYSVSKYRISYIPVLYPSPSKNNIKPNCLRNIRKSIKSKQRFPTLSPTSPTSQPKKKHPDLAKGIDPLKFLAANPRWLANGSFTHQPTLWNRVLRENRSYIQNLSKSEATFPPIIINIINNIIIIIIIIIIIFTIIIWRSPNISHIATSSSP